MFDLKCSVTTTTTTSAGKETKPYSTAYRIDRQAYLAPVHPVPVDQPVERRRQRRGVVKADRLGRLPLGERRREKARGEKAGNAERHHLPRRRHTRPFERPVRVGGRQRGEQVGSASWREGECK